MRVRAAVLSALASAATLGAGWAAWAVPHAAQASAQTAQSGSQHSAAAATSAAAVPTTSAKSSATATPSASATASASASASSSSAYAGYSGTLTGTAVTMRYGTVQVSVTLSSGTITGVTVLQAPTSGRDAAYTNRAVPVLQQEVLSAQSANVAIVSGATFISDAYLQSLQAALDQAK